MYTIGRHIHECICTFLILSYVRVVVGSEHLLVGLKNNNVKLEFQRPTFVFTHIPKAGGSTFGMALCGEQVACLANGIEAHNPKYRRKLNPGRTLQFEPLQTCTHPWTPDSLLRTFSSIEKNPHLINDKSTAGCNYVVSETQVKTVARILPKLLEYMHDGGMKSDQNSTGPVYAMYLLRQPQEHVISMWKHCQIGRGQSLHHYPSISLAEWVNMWSEGYEPTSEFFRNASTYCPYNPRNFQTRHLATDGAVWFNGDPVWDLATRTSASTHDMLQVASDIITQGFSVGILEKYIESLCLARHKVAQVVGAYRGRTTKANSEMPLTSETVDDCVQRIHKKARYSHTASPPYTTEIPAKTLKQMYTITKADWRLYEVAVDRFETMLSDVTGKRKPDLHLYSPLKHKTSPDKQVPNAISVGKAKIFLVDA
eukprot:m.99695 g.99695  ORF g.99695 m.99695 type:complete len:426 (-) comp27180_c1_seq1:84-1361(-)